MSLPTISNVYQIVPRLKLWQNKLNRLIAAPTRHRPTFNFRATGASSGAGVSLDWEPVRGADGYIVSYSDNHADFASAPAGVLVLHVQNEVLDIRHRLAG